MKATLSAVRALALLAASAVFPTQAALCADWTTPAEQAKFATTASYEQTRTYLQRLAAAAPDTIHLSRFGVSPEGRDLMLVVAANDGEFTPAAARASGKEIVLVQAGIHAGEIEGNDAGLMLLRDLSVGARQKPTARSRDPGLPADLQRRRSREHKPVSPASTRTDRARWVSARPRSTSISIATT